MLDDIRYWIAHDSDGPDEIAVRFHHRLVWIQMFPNGNGRRARLTADLLLVTLGRSRFTWGRENLVNAGEPRNAYVEALRAADKHDYDPFLTLVRT